MVLRPLVIDLRQLLLLDAGRRRGAALLSGADWCGRLPGVRIAGLAVSVRCYASSREAQHCAACALTWAPRSELAACKTLARNVHAVVRVPFGSPMVQRDQWDTYWGAKKIFFLIRAIDDATKAGASVESCRLAAHEPSGSRFGSVLDMCNRLRRLRRRFQINIHLPALYLYWP